MLPLHDITLDIKWPFCHMLKFVLKLYASSQQFFSHIGMFSCLPGLNQYYAADTVSCSSTQHGDSGESQTSNPSILSLTLHQLSHCAPSVILKICQMCAESDSNFNKNTIFRLTPFFCWIIYVGFLL